MSAALPTIAAARAGIRQVAGDALITRSRFLPSLSYLLTFYELDDEEKALFEKSAASVKETHEAMKKLVTL